MSSWSQSFWDAWSSWGWPLFLMLVQSLVLLVAVLVILAFLLLADRKIWAAVQMRKGPNVVGPFGLLQSFADLLKFVAQGAADPGRRGQGGLPAGAAGDGDLRAGAPGPSFPCRRTVGANG